MENIVRVKSIEHLTHDVLRIETEKPHAFQYVPGQAADITLRKEPWQNERRAFTFTSLPQEDRLEFSIKTYPSRKGVANELLKLKPGDELTVYDVFGDIHYKGEGVFIAGGAGITPFISIFRDLHSRNQIGNNKLIFANKTRADIIRYDDFNTWLGKNFINVLSDERTSGFAHGYITEELLKPMIAAGVNVYLCGPPPMMEAVEKILSNLGVDTSLIVKEAF